ncbi:sugar-binding transcriptional regulator [Arthrobacter monumenti]
MPEQTHEQFLAKIGREHFLDGKSKVEIANTYGISRFHVARLLEEAREVGIVKIEVSTPGTAAPADTELIKKELGLTRLIMTAGSADSARNREVMAQAAAAELSESARAGMTVGISWSRTLATTARFVTKLPKCDIVQLAGALPMSGSGHSFEVIHRLGGLSGGNTWPLFAPLVVDDAATAAGLRRQPEIAHALEKADTLDLAVIAIGAWAPNHSTVWERVGNNDRREGTAAGAVAECSGRLIDADGQAVLTAMDERIIAVTVEQLRATPEIIAVAPGSERAAAVIAACKANIITTLIADEPLVSALSAALTKEADL